MGWTDDILKQLAAAPAGGYAAGRPVATEPTALACLALIANSQRDAAAAGLSWLVSNQSSDGSFGPMAGQPSPQWPTSLAALAWMSADASSNAAPGAHAHALNIQRAIEWILAAQGRTMPRMDEMGHDPTLLGWPWAEDTHAWVEPTAFHILALKAAGRVDHARTRIGVRMLIDRLLPDGGCNYGNTTVLGQELRPHIQPTGIALLALAGEQDPQSRIARSVEYLLHEVSASTTTASMCYALMGLAAHGRLPDEHQAWLSEAYLRTMQRDRSPWKLALLSLAALGEACPLITLPKARPSL